MATYGTKLLAIAAAASLALGGCSSDDEPPAGTLTYYLTTGDIDHLDPQRVYNGVVVSALSRTVYRSWLTFPVSKDPGVSTTGVPDLATDTGTPSADAKTWKFTLRDGATWEDGRLVTCEDFKYGASRVFATDTITEGPQYLLDYLDVPIDPKTHLPIYTGPYHHSAKGEAAFDRAIICDGRTITYRFRKPWADFRLAIASLHMMDPYREDKDQGAKSDFQIFSNGPYRLRGAWDVKTGGTLVRNENYDPETDPTKARKALPDRIDIVVSKTPEQVTDLLVRDRGRDRAAISGNSIPISRYGDITGDVADRARTVPTPYVIYLLPNFARLTNPKVREALAASTDVSAWVDAGGGGNRLAEATDILPPVMKGHDADLFPGGAGDSAEARQLLAEAGVRTPYPITFTYPGDWGTEKQAAALAAGWEQGGFAVTVTPVKDTIEYFDALERPDKTADVMLMLWGPDGPSAMTVIPPLFDSRRNLTNDFGRYRSAGVEALIDRAQLATDTVSQTQALQQADQLLKKDVAYIPLATPAFYLLHGSAVTGYVNTAASSGYPDLGAIGVR